MTRRASQAGLDPACVRACPTDALVYGERMRGRGRSPARGARDPGALGPRGYGSQGDVSYIGLAGFEGEQLHRGAALDPRDPDPIYEQR